MVQNVISARKEVAEVSLGEVLDDMEMTEEEFRTLGESGIQEFRDGKTIPFEQLKRECGLD